LSPDGLKRVAAQAEAGFASQPANSTNCCARADSICAQRAAERNPRVMARKIVATDDGAGA
jgi:hypothetical protein